MENGRTMTDADIKAIVAALQETEKHCCRYDIEPDEMREMFKFVKNWNDTIIDGKKTIGKTILVASITGLFILLGLGAVSKIQQVVK